MSNARQELYELEDTSQQEAKPAEENLSKKDVSEAISSYFEEQKKAKKKPSK